MKEWTCQCLPLTPRNQQLLLVWDTFWAHLTDEVKANLKRHSIYIAVIPGGLTPCFTAARQMLKEALQRQGQKKVLGMDEWPYQVHSNWNEGAI